MLEPGTMQDMTELVFLLCIQVMSTDEQIGVLQDKLHPLRTVPITPGWSIPGYPGHVSTSKLQTV